MKRLPLVVALSTLAAACSGCPRQETPPAAEAARGPEEKAHDDGFLHIDPGMLRDLRITTAAVESRTGVAEVSMLGQLTVDQNGYAEVAPPIEAQVLRLLVSANANVRAGEALAELRSVDLGRARAEYMTAQARVDLATRALERKKTLAAERIVATREVQEAEAQLRENEAGRAAAEAALGALGIPLQDQPRPEDASRFLLRAPIAGSVLERAGVVGQMAAPSTALFRIADLTRVWLVVHAFERDAVRVSVGSSARIMLAAYPAREFAGRVAVVGREVQSESRSVDIRIELPNPDGLLRPGMSATALIPVGSEDRLLLSVPVAAVQRVGENWVVFLQREPGAFEMRPVGRGRDLGAEVEIVRGLKAGETVVVEGAFLLKAEAEKAAGGEEHAHGD